MRQDIVIQFISGIRDGGAETLVKDYATLMDKQRCKVIIVCILPPNENSANVQLLKAAGAEIIPIYEKFPLFKTWVAQKIWNKLFFNHYIYLRLKNIIKDLQPRCIHVHLEVLRYLKPISNHIKGIKLLYTCHSLPHRYFNNTNLKQETLAARHLIKHNGLQFIALHEQMRAELNQMFDIDDTIVVHNGVDLSRFANIDGTTREIRESINVPNDAFVIGHVGRFFAPKNHAKIIYIFYQTLQQKPNAHLLLVGDGELKSATIDKLENLGLNGKYTILSHRSDIPRLMKAMDVLLFPSLFEGLPVTLIEAQAVGLRCVVSNRITTECFFSQEVVPLDIDAPAETWAEAIINQSIKGNFNADIKQFDMHYVIKHLENIYLK